VINNNDVIFDHVIQAGDHVTEEVVSNGDHVTQEVVTNGDEVTHPLATANESEQAEPHPPNSSDNVTPEPHLSTLTNGLDHPATSSMACTEEHTVPIEDHSDISSMINGRYSPLEKQADPTPVEQTRSGKLLSCISALLAIWLRELIVY